MDQGYCQYYRLFSLHYKCHPHKKELACGSRSRVIDLKLSTKKSVFSSYLNDKFNDITNISSSMEMILSRRMNQWIFTNYLPHIISDPDLVFFWSRAAEKPRKIGCLEIPLIWALPTEEFHFNFRHVFSWILRRLSIK